MQSSKRRPANTHNFTSNDHFSEEKLRQIIKNVRRAADNFIVPRNGDGESDGRKFSCPKAGPEVGSNCEPATEWSVSCRRPTEHEIDKLMQELTSAKSCDGPDRQSFLATVDEQQVELELKEEAAPPSEAALEALSNGELESEESEISPASSNASLGDAAKLPADVEDNLTYSTSDDSRPSSPGNTSHQDIEVESESSFFSEPSAAEMERMTFATRPIEPDSDGAESYCETLPADRPIMQVRIRSLPASHGIRLASLRTPPSDGPAEPLIDFAQIERNTKLLHARHNMLLLPR